MIQKRHARRLSKFNRILLWINYVCVVCLFLAVVCKYISPQYFWILAFFGLAFPFFVIINFGFVIYWFAQFRVQALFSFLAIVFTINTTLGFFQINFSKTEKSNKDLKMRKNIKIN